MKKKILISIILVILIFVLVSTSSAVNVNTDDKKNIEPLDNGYFEIFTNIDGYCENLECKGILIKRHMKIWVSGLGLDIEAHTLNPSNPIYKAKPSYLYIPVFIGWSWMVSANCYTIEGIAFGNIYWE